jgi:hypothetical protein
MAKNLKNFGFIMLAAAVGIVVGAPLISRILPDSIQDDLNG